MSLCRLVSTSHLLRSTARNAARFHPTFGLFAARHGHVQKPGSSLMVGLGSTRGLSFWGSTSAPVPPPAPIAPKVLENTLQPDVASASIPVSESPSMSEVVTSIDIPSALSVAPLNYGDLAALGFSHWTPAGIAQWTMELIQVSSGISWFWTIVVATVLARLVVVPLSLGGVRASAKLAPHQPRLMELRDQLQKAGGLGENPIAVQRITLQQKKIYEEAGVSLLAPIATPLAQVPTSMGMFFGIRSLCNLPLEQLKTGGFGWITDLTIADPTYALPLAMVAMMNVQLSLMSKETTVGNTQMLHMFNVFKVVGFVSVPLMMHLPAGVMVYMLTQVILIAAQAFILRSPSVRKALDIPKIPNHPQIKPPTFLESVKAGADWFKQKNAEAQAQAKAQRRKKI